jgi:AcrR family transcriptional regulator
MNVKMFKMRNGKIAHILDAAFETFIRYGFRRTTMGDLAAAAGVSRPALYTHFRNKEDLFRAVAARELNAAVERGLAELERPGHLCDRLLNAYRRWCGDFLALFETSPHAREILDLNHAIAEDITAAAAERFHQGVVATIEQAAVTGAIDLSRSGRTPTELMQLLTDVSVGAERRLSDPATYQGRLVTALALIDTATRKRGARGWTPPEPA